jgi:hypothetical protein
MSKMGRVVQEIMEMHNGEIPKGYTLKDYFDEKAKNKSKTKDSSTSTPKNNGGGNEM